MAQLPQELIAEILSRLPVRTLKRFRCLSKSLCAFIDSPHFIDSHLSKSSQNSNLRKLIFRDSWRKKFHICDVNFDLEEEVLRLGTPVSYPWKFVYGYCKGLLLLYRHKLKFSLWNPSTRQYRDLPDCPLESLRPANNNEICNLIGFGLSYDDSIDDYKAICMVQVRQLFNPKFDVEVWIYGLKSNIWRKSQNWDFLLSIEQDDDFLLTGPGYFTPTDGIIHWLCTINSYKEEIVAFDVRKETFFVVPQPVCSLNSDSEKEVSTSLHVLEGCLCISYFSSSMPLQADLYIRKKDGADQFTWIKIFSVTEPLFVDKIWFKGLNVLGYSKGGDKILLDIGMNFMVLVSYDLKEKSFDKVSVDTDPNWKWPILCLESLVSVDMNS